MGGGKIDLRTQLLHFFLKGHTKDIVVLYQDSQLYGTVSYRTLLKNSKIEEAISHIFLTLDEKIWEEARKAFEISQERFLPVLDRQGNLDCFCYQDEISDTLVYSYLKILKDYDNKYLWINELYPEIEIVHILGVNEYAYNFYQICLKNNTDVYLEGERWKLLEHKPIVDISKYPDYSIMTIYADGAYDVKVENEYGQYPYPSADIWWSSVIRKILAENIRLAHDRLLIKIIEDKINCGILLIPESNEIIKTADEQRYISFGKELIYEYIIHNSTSKAALKAMVSIYGEDTINKLKKEGNINGSSEYFYEGFGEDRVKSTKSFVKNIHSIKIYLIGPCIVNGNGNISQQSLNGVLQKMMDELYPDEYLVISKNVERYNPFKLEHALEGLNINNQDMVIMIDESYLYSNLTGIPENIKICRSNPLYLEADRKNMFSVQPIHSNYYGNQKLAGLILEELIKPNLRQKRTGKQIIQNGRIISGTEEKKLLNTLNNMKSYLSKPIEKREKCGSIVMNCNPFTNGHLHLVEYAVSKVDRLIIFVVEEDKSVFPFISRFQMVKDGVNQFHNIDVIPSGKFILSCKTFAAYFEKEEYKEAIVDASNDLRLFCEYVAPAFNISIRFAGEEPVDFVTKQYNCQMKELLPLYNIKFEEIHRLETENEIVSASIVRSYMQQNKLENIEKLVPDTTIPYILEQMKIKKN